MTNNLVTHDGRNYKFTQDEFYKFVADGLSSGMFLEDSESVGKTKDALLKSLLPLEDLEKKFWFKHSKLLESMEALEEATKKSTGKARDLHHKTNEALIKLDKSINLDVLDRKVQLLERACDAMERLNALQQTGKLDKILQAIK